MSRFRSVSDQYWRSLALFNIFRLLIVIGLVLGVFALGSSLFAHQDDLYRLLVILSVYTFCSILFIFGIARRSPAFDLQLAVHVVLDMLVITAIMHLAGGIRSGLGILMLPYLAAAGLIARGRMALFHAAIATIALLFESMLSYVQGGTDAPHPATVLLCIASFAVAWLAHRLARYAEENRALAEKRQVDLDNLAQVNVRILQDVSDGVMVIDNANLIRQYNEQTVRFTGVRPALMSELDADLPELATPLARWRNDPDSASELIQTAGGRNTLRVRFVALGDKPAGIVLVYLEDMAKLRREAQQLKLAALGRLTANLAHEIRNPLSAISHAAQLMQEETLEDPVQQKLLRIINDNTGRLERMVKDVLELNRRDRVQRADIALAEWLGKFVEEFSLQERIGVALPLVCPADACARFDPGHLHQVLWNLMRNGWRYSTQVAGSLTLQVHQHGTDWALDVINDGPPVPADAQTQLFEPFFTTESKGTGLGLYIAREICAANAALLEYIAPPDGGACFRIVFGYTDGQKV